MKRSSKQRAITSLTFNVGPYPYSLSISPGPLLYEGRAVNAISLEFSREIVICGELPPAHRLTMLLRELTRTWTFVTGEPAPTNADGWSDLSATVAVSAFKDLAAQGGEAALLALQPLPLKRTQACRTEGSAA